MVQKLFLVFFRRYFLSVSNVRDSINERRNLPILASSSYSKAQILM